jgi:hypothetical protein
VLRCTARKVIRNKPAKAVITFRLIEAKDWFESLILINY